MTNLEVLRAETHALHEQLERNPLLAHLSEPDFPLAEYRELLVRMLGFYAPLEALLASWSAELGLDLREREKAHLLRRDLAALGMPGGELAYFPRCPDLPPVHSPEGAFGCLYVLEGATLGGRVISKHLARVHGLGVANGAAFFNSYGDRAGVMWRAMCERLNAHPAGDEGRARMAEAARQTFETLDRWLLL